MKKIILLLSLAIPALTAFAQQDPQFTQNMFLKLPVNPGYAGTGKTLCATAVYRSQWVGFTGSPKTFLFTTDVPVIELNGGLGLTFVKDKLGNFNFTMARGAYSYHRPIGIGLLGIGIELGMLQSSVDYNWIAPDGTSGEFDQAIPYAYVNKTTYDVGLGAYYKTEKLYVGASVSHLPGKAEQLTAPKFNYQAARHYYVMAGYQFDLTRKLKLLPSTHIKSDAAVTTIDLSCNLLYNESIWGGLSYRLQDAFAPYAGVAFKPNGPKSTSILKIGYAYDLGLSDLKAHHRNTHEIMVSYCMKWDKIIPPTTHIFPRNMKGKNE